MLAERGDRPGRWWQTWSTTRSSTTGSGSSPIRRGSTCVAERVAAMRDGRSASGVRRIGSRGRPAARRADRCGAVGFGAMVLSPGLYGQVDDDRATHALLARPRRGSSFDRHVRRLRQRCTQRTPDRGVARASPGRGGDLDEVRLPRPARGRAPSGRDRLRLDRGQRRAAAHPRLRPRQPRSSAAPTGSTCTPRTSRTPACRSRRPSGDGRARRRWPGAPPRTVERDRRDSSSGRRRSTRSARCSASGRCGPHPILRCSQSPTATASAWSRGRRSAVASSPARSPSSILTTSATGSLASRARTWR